MILTVHTQKETNELGDLYGLFFEDLNHAADGGLYAGLVQNRSFEFDSIDNPEYNSLTAWKAVGGAVLAVQEGGAVSEKNPHYLEITAAGYEEAGGTGRPLCHDGGTGSDTAATSPATGATAHGGTATANDRTGTAATGSATSIRHAPA